MSNKGTCRENDQQEEENTCMNYRKVFEKVNHNILIGMLKNMMYCKIVLIYKMYTNLKLQI